MPLLETAVASARPRAQERHVTVELDVDPVLAAPLVAALLRPAVDNVIHNALRYSPPGSTVTVRSWRDGPCAVIEVLDEGPGFPAEFLPHAFDRFSRVDLSRTGDDHAGLGLAIVQAVADAHRGGATAANRPSGGAVVTIRIPATV
jgi:two-component system, OmpR family, sensor kinase